MIMTKRFGKSQSKLKRDNPAYYFLNMPAIGPINDAATEKMRECFSELIASKSVLSLDVYKLFFKYCINAIHEEMQYFEQDDVVYQDGLIVPDSLHIRALDITLAMTRFSDDRRKENNNGVREDNFQSPLLPLLEMADAHGRTLLHWAAKVGERKLFKKLLEKTRGHGLTSVDRQGSTPFHFACRSKNTALVEFIYEQMWQDERNPINQTNHLQQTPLHFVLGWGRESDIVDFLIEQGADQCAQDSQGNTPLNAALFLKADLAACYMLDHDSFNRNSLNIMNHKGQTPLSYALEFKLFSIAQKLVDKGADTGIVEPDLLQAWQEYRQAQESRASSVRNNDRYRLASASGAEGIVPGENSQEDSDYVVPTL